MTVFSHPSFQDHERVTFFHDKETGLKAIIAIHNSKLGPALGGCRMWNYDNDEEAFEDVLRLSRGMTYKAAISGLPLGGGKSVIIGDSQKDKTPELMQAMGRAVESLDGGYIIAEDVGTSVEDMRYIETGTKHVVGLPTDGATLESGDPSPLTALGVFTGLKAAAQYRLGVEELTGLTVSVQGLGHVGYTLCKLLSEAGANLVVTDINQGSIDRVVSEFAATGVGLDDIYDIDTDIYAPCALGATLNDNTIPRLKVEVVAGAANNQLAEERHGDMLRERNILYTPDYVINAGGLIKVYYEQQARLAGKPLNLGDVKNKIQEIETTTKSIFAKSEKDDISTGLAANRIAEALFMSNSEAANEAA